MRKLKFRCIQISYVNKLKLAFVISRIFQMQKNTKICKNHKLIEQDQKLVDMSLGRFLRKIDW